jgi:hypothetical protein
MVLEDKAGLVQDDSMVCALTFPGRQLISLHRMPVLLDGGQHLRIVPGVRGAARRIVRATTSG